MIIDRLLARFSIQTKVLVFVVPLITGVGALAAINFYTGSMLGHRLDSAGASIQSLSGFQRAYSGMNEFLQSATVEKRDQVILHLDEQVAKLEDVIGLAGTEAERQALENARAVADHLRARIDELWQLNGQELAIREDLAEVRQTLVAIDGSLDERLGSIAEEIVVNEEAAKDLLRRAEFLETSARQVVEIATAIATPQDTDTVFAEAERLRRDMRRIKTKLPRAIPDGQPGLASTISDNLKGILEVIDAGLANEPGMLKIQRFANGLRPVGLRLQGLASQLSREATVRFSEIDPLVVRGRKMIEDARTFADASVDLELLITEFLGFPTTAHAEKLAVGLVRLEQALQQMELDEGGGAELVELIGDEPLSKVRGLTLLATGLVEKVEARRMSFNEADEQIADAWKSILAFADSQREGAEQVKDRAEGITLSGAAVAGIGSLLAALFLVAALKGPILRLVRAMRNVAQGDLDIAIDDADRRDEIGEMARALAIFKSNALDKIRAERESDDARSQATAERERRDAEKAHAEAELQAAVASLGSALRNLAAGDLVSTIETPFVGELDRLRVDFNESVERVRDAMAQIRDNASLIQANSEQMRTAADDLSRRTEQQAASLEETAAAVDEISSTVRNSSERAADTNKLAAETRNDAIHSGEVVARAVDAMTRIETASSKIGQIISVIDGIAFQTNSLALNAGVEAARAGDAGRGFAVVAQEVRELAGRSAQAAREIKELIARSGEEVTNGVSLVNETGETIARITERISEMTAHIDSLATGSREQATGLAEVNDAVNAMDQTTQQNAAMVEQTNAASHQLASEAVSLMEMVRQFRIEVSDVLEVQRAA